MAPTEHGCLAARDHRARVTGLGVERDPRQHLGERALAAARAAEEADDLTRGDREAEPVQRDICRTWPLCRVFERQIAEDDRIAVLGHRLRSLPKRRVPELRFHVGYLAQDAGSSLAADRSVAELIAEPILERDRRYNQRALATRVATMLDSVRLPLGFLEKYPYELSGGQRQRVALARALVLGPSVLVADEPTAGIDLTVRDAVAQLIGELRERQRFSALLISHDLPVLRRTADRIAVLDHGNLAALGTIEEVFHDPSHPYVAALAGALDDGHAVIDDLDEGLGA